MDLSLPACSSSNQEREEGLRKMEIKKVEIVCERKSCTKRLVEGPGGPESY